MIDTIENVSPGMLRIATLYPINTLRLSDTYMYQWTASSLVQVMACHICGVKPLPGPVKAFCQFDTWKQILLKF